MEFTEWTLFLVTIFFSLLHPSSSSNLNNMNEDIVERIHVGLILDQHSWVGKIVDSCISMAISDFYSLNSHYKTKLVLHTRDSEGDPLLTLSQALVLLGSVKLHAIIVAENSAGVKILAELGTRAKIPIITLLVGGPSLSFSEYPYLIQIGQDESFQAKGIATIVDQVFSWKNIILIYEDGDSGEILPKLITSLEGTDVRLAQHIAISPSSPDEEIIEQLKKLMSLQTTVYVVHMSPSLASRLFLNAKHLGMISQGYAWITTDMIMNFLHSMEPSVVESMQGVVGFRPYIPPSKELRKFSIRWKSKNLVETQDIQEMELNAYGVWSYDMIWALATAAEMVMTRLPDVIHQETRLNISFTTILSSQSGLAFIDEILHSGFKGISRGFQLTNGRRLIPRKFEIVNVFKGERIVGHWTPGNGITTITKQDNHNEMNSTSSSKLEAVVWPGGTMNVPKGWSLCGKRLRIGVPVRKAFNELIKVNIVDPQTNETDVSGFCIDVFKEAIKTLDYEVNYEFIPFANAKGSKAEYYTDLIHQVYLKNYDAVVGDTTITANRLSYVDFTLPFTDSGVGMVVRKANENNMWVFLKPLAGNLWITTAVFFIFTGFVVWLIERPINDEFQGPPSKQIGTIFWFSFSTLVFAHREKLLSNLSNFVLIIWVFVVLILSSSYTATLTSMLTVQQIHLISRDDSIGYISAISFQRATSNLNFELRKLKRFETPEEYANALTKGSKNGGVSAIFDEIPYIKIFLAKYPSDYTMIKSYSTTGGFGFVFPKGSPLVQDISKAILRLREEEKLQTIENKWLKSDDESSFSTQDSTNNPSSLNLHSFVGLFLVTGISSTSALLICLYQKRQSITLTINNFKCYFNPSLDSLKGCFNMSLKKLIYDT